MAEPKPPLFVQARLCDNPNLITGEIESFCGDFLICAVLGNSDDGPPKKLVMFSDCSSLVIFDKATITYIAPNGKQSSVSGCKREDYSTKRGVAIKDATTGSRTVFIISRDSILSVNPG